MQGCLAGSAQTLHIKDASVTYSYTAETAGEMTFGTGNTLTADGRTFTLTENTLMWTDEAAVEDNVVTVTYAGTTAEVVIAGNIARYVDATVSGANVSITQSADVSAETCGEITYRLTGSSADGSFAMTGGFKATVELAGLNLTSATGAALDIQNGKRIALKLADGTENVLADGAGGSQK